MSRYHHRKSGSFLRSVTAALALLSLCPGPLPALDDTKTLEIPGAAAGDRFGAAVACHLGRPVVGAPGAGDTGAGTVTILDPANGAPSQVIPSFTELNDGAFGSVIATVGDVNGDAVEDLAVSAPGSFGVGQVFIFAGMLPVGVESGPLAVLNGFDTAGEFGRAVVGLGDIDGDGRAEVAVSSSGFDGVGEGAVHVISPFGELNEGPLYVITGSSGEDLGFSLASIRDIDGDGIREIVAGAPRANSGRGSVRVFSGATGDLIASINGSTDGQVFGHAVANVGDIDADGFDDILIGAPSTGGVTGAGVGRAILVSGGSLLGSPIRSLCDLRGVGFGDRFGATLAAIADITGDGVGDFVIGAPNTPRIEEGADEGEDVITENLGTVHVYRYAAGGCRVFDVLNGPMPQENKRLGVSMTSCLFTDDAFPDLVVGTRADQPAASVTAQAEDAGSLVIFRGEPPPPPPTGASFTFRISRDGDLTARIDYDSDPFGNCDLQIFGRTQQSGVVNDLFLLGEGTPQGAVNNFLVEGIPQAAKVNKSKPILHAVVRTTCGSTVLDSNIFARFLNCGTLPALPLDEWQATVEEIISDENATSLTVKERRPKTKKQRMKERQKKKRKQARKKMRAAARGR